MEQISEQHFLLGNEVWDEKIFALANEITGLCEKATEGGMPLSATFKAISFVLVDAVFEATSISKERLQLFDWIMKMAEEWLEIMCRQENEEKKH
jgi:hypothetical protein